MTVLRRVSPVHFLYVFVFALFALAAAVWVARIDFPSIMGVRPALVDSAGQVEYRAFPIVGSRVIVWIFAELHLMFAAFVLAVPMFALIIELIGYKTGEKRYDDLAYEFTKLLSVAFSFTATLGASLVFLLVFLYPKFTSYLASIFGWTFLPYALLFFAEAGFLYSYYYGWGLVINFSQGGMSTATDKRAPYGLRDCGH